MRISDWSSDVCSSDLAQEAMQNPQAQEVDPAQAQQAFQQGQQQILAKYAPMLKEAESQVPIEDVMKLLRDDKGRNFTFEIESSSTIMTDELQEKQSRNEFMQAFTNASQRSEEQTSEPQSLMRHSYSTFILQQKKNEHIKQ